MKVRTEARRDAIVSEATILFCEKGFERASMSELAKRLGGSKTTLYSYFTSKESLFIAVVESIGEAHIDMALKELSQRDDRDLKEVLRQFAEKMIALINKPDALAVYRMVIGEAGHSEIGQLFYNIGPQRIIDGVSQIMSQAVENGILRPCEPGIAARHFLSLIKSESEDHLFQYNPLILAKTEVKESIARAIDVFMAGYLAP